MLHVALIGSRSSIHVVRWANALSKRGIKITVFSMHCSGEPFDAGVDVVEMPFKNPFGYILNIPFLKARIKDLKPDIVHSFYAFGHSFLGRKCSGKIPHIVSVLGSDIFDDVHKNRFYPSIIVRNILDAEVVCSTSKVMAKQIEKVCGQKMEIKITPFGIDTSLFNPSLYNRKETDTFTIGTVKWIEHKYGIDVLIKAFAGFCELHPSEKIKLIIVGAGSKEQEYKELVEELNIKDVCSFAGAVRHKEIPSYLASFDVYAALSRLDSESFGVAVLEASAMELPVIVSDAGGLPEVVSNRETGLIVKRENIEETIEALEYIFENRTQAREMGLKGRQYVLDKYDWTNSQKIMRKVYQSL